MTAPKISVVIPSALKRQPNGETWLTQALRSVAAQMLQPVEVIVGIDYRLLPENATCASPPIESDLDFRAALIRSTRQDPKRCSVARR